MSRKIKQKEIAPIRLPAVTPFQHNAPFAENQHQETISLNIAHILK